MAADNPDSGRRRSAPCRGRNGWRRTFTANQTTITYTLTEDGEAVVENVCLADRGSIHERTLAVPPLLDGCPVTSVTVAPASAQDANASNLLLPDTVRTFTSRVFTEVYWYNMKRYEVNYPFQIGTLYCFGSDTVIDAADGSVGKVCCFAGSQTESSVPDGIPVVSYTPDRFENGCLFTGSVVDMIAPQSQPVFVVPETLGGKTVTAVHAEALADRCDLASVELPAACDLLDLDGNYLEVQYPLPTLRCVFNGSANRTCYRYLMSCVQLLPDGSEHAVNYHEIVASDTSSLLPEDATFLDLQIRDGEVYVTGITPCIIDADPWLGAGGSLYFAPEDLVIPASINGCPVVSVGGMSASRYTEGFEEPDIVLHTVTLPPTVREIEAEAFMMQTQLTSVNVENVETVGRSAFSGCSSLTELRFGKNLKWLESSECTGVSSALRVSFDPDCPLETIHPFLEVRMDTLVLPNHVKTISRGAFENVGIDTIVVPASVEHIEHSTFEQVGTIVMLSRNAELAEPGHIPVGSGGQYYGVDGWTGGTDDQMPTIYCYENSTAHAYAQKYGVPFVLLDESALLLDGEPAAQMVYLPEPMEKDAFLQSLSVQGGAQADVRCGDMVTTGAAVTLTDPVFGHTERTYTVVCAGDTDGDGVCYTQADVDMVRKMNAGLISENDVSAAFAAADVYRDGLVNSTDVTLMRIIMAGL